MTKEQRFFLELLADFLAGRKTEARPGLDWDALLSCAQKQQLSGVLYYQCAAFLPESVRPALHERYAGELFFYYNREALLAQVSDALGKAGIPFFSVKGLDVARLYPVPALRTMGDCDIVVRPEDQARAHPVLLSLGFTLGKKDAAEWVYAKNRLELELHSHLLYDEVANTPAERAFFDAAWDYTRPTAQGMRCELDWSFHFLFLLLHLKKHLVQSGVGFRQFMDLAAALRRCELDWPWLERSLAALGLRDFARVCFTLLHRWFGTENPLPPAALEPSFGDTAAERIFAGGVFGFDDEANRNNAQMYELNHRRGPFARLRYLLSACFLPYELLRAVPEYAFLDGRPWLLPAAWLYRLFFKLGRRRGQAGARLMLAAFIPGRRLDERRRELEKWGL